MKKILSVLAVLVVFAADNFGANGNQFQLQTKIAAKDHVFYLSTDGRNALAKDEIVETSVDLTQAGSYEGVSLWLAEGGNQSVEATYAVSVNNTGFKGVTPTNKDTHPSTVTFKDSGIATTSVTVAAGPTAKGEKAKIKVEWAGNPDLTADTYVDTITVTVTKN